LVRGVLPLGKGVVLDPFAGSGSTLAACEAIGYESVGVERDREYFDLAIDAIPKLSNLDIRQARVRCQTRCPSGYCSCAGVRSRMET